MRRGGEGGGEGRGGKRRGEGEGDGSGGSRSHCTAVSLTGNYQISLSHCCTRKSHL